MAINFEAANMAGYNNPKMCIFPVTIKLDGGTVVEGNLNYSTITNIIKSGYLPSLYATMPTGDRVILPLAGISNQGLYQFCAATFTTDSKVLISITYGSQLVHPIFKSEIIS